MAHPIRVDSPFATAHDTADTLGVSKSRANTLIQRTLKKVSRIAFRDSSTGEFATEVRYKRKASTDKSSRPNGGTKAYRAKPKKAKAKR
jgi:hypothetical protein